MNVSGVVLEGYFALATEETIGTNYCMTNPNSSGGFAVIGATGSTLASANDVTLQASGMPAGQFGFFLNSQTPGFIGNPGTSQGNLCLAGNIGRYNGDIFLSDAAGTSSLTLDLSMTPTPMGLTAIMAGETWHFQAWFRDVNPVPTSNFTDGLEILFN